MLHCIILFFRGSFEWKGDWSDSSALWSSHPGVALEIGRPKVLDDGVFYMAWEDFVLHFDLVDVLFSSVGVDNLHLKVRENTLCCGTAMGCVMGCCSFWCGCKGYYTLWFEESSKKLEVEGDQFGII